MSSFQKIVERFCRLPTDFYYDELRSMLRGFDYVEDNKGKTSGSRVAFVHSKTKHIIRLHKPHPSPNLKKYQMNLIFDELKAQGVLK